MSSNSDGQDLDNLLVHERAGLDEAVKDLVWESAHVAGGSTARGHA